MLQMQHLPASQAAVAAGRTSMLAAASAELTRALGRAHAGYTFDASLCNAVDVIVAELQREGQSIDDAMDVVGASVRVIRPSDTSLNDDALGRAWRSYFALYDLSIQRTIRAFVIGSIESDAGAVRPVPGKCLRLSQRGLPADSVAAPPGLERARKIGGPTLMQAPPEAESSL